MALEILKISEEKKKREKLKEWSVVHVFLLNYDTLFVKICLFLEFYNKFSTKKAPAEFIKKKKNCPRFCVFKEKGRHCRHETNRSKSCNFVACVSLRNLKT